MILPDGYSEIPAGKVAAVVTSLEMRAAPPRRPDTAASGLALRHVESPDPGWYRALFRRVGENWLWFSRLNLADAALAGIIRDPGVEVHALAADGSEEGLAELDFRRSGECELAFFGVSERLIGTPAARWLMNRVLDRVWARPIERFWVHTCTLDHPAALAFYVRSGFRPFRREIEVADDPRLLGLAPISAAPHVPVIAAKPR